MKSVFALIAAVAVLTSAQASFASNPHCTKSHKGSRAKLHEPTGARSASTSQSVKAVK